MSKLGSMMRRAGCTALASAFLMAFAATGSAEEAKAPPPPYLMMGMNSSFYAVSWEPGSIDPLLPEGLKAADDYSGGINLYTVDAGYGFGAYSAAYFYVNLNSHVSDSKLPGRYVLGGIYGPGPVAEAMKSYYGFKVQLGETKQETKDGVVRASAHSDGKPLFAIETTKVASECPVINGTVNYVGEAGDGTFIVLPIPFAGGYCAAEPHGALELSAAADHYLQGSKVAKVLAAGHLKNASFSFTQPQK